MIEFGKGYLSGINLVDPKIHADINLQKIWKYIRSVQPIVWHPTEQGGFWVVSKYHDIRKILSDNEHFTSEHGNSLDSLLAGRNPAAEKMLTFSQGERHLAIRSEILKSLKRFTMQRITKNIEHNIRKRVTDILDTQCDLAEDFAKDIVLETICNLMGIENNQQKNELHSLSAKALSSVNRNATVEESAIARNGILMLFANIVEKRRSSLGDDLVSTLIKIEKTKINISFEEILYNCYMLFLGGNEEPRNAVVGMLKALSEDSIQWHQLKNKEINIDEAVEEILRWTTSLSHLGRTVVKDVSIGNQTFRSGEIVSLWISSANFDEEVFSNPYSLVLNRSDNAHLSFGHGNHYCLGASLTRTIITKMITVLIDLVETIEIRGEIKPVYSNFLSGISSLPGCLHSCKYE
ncbi:cytochrome P450 [Candidatus Uabimicrobium sp. HlEnr_7]|uniref:cytochrome P450 n=1 Tax=Candidatus Uabimicrobium helgolandensis TaxID=3095367 RepID=UPI00355682AF